MKKVFALRKLLLPLVPFYRIGLEVRELAFGWGLIPVRRLKAPVISIGNLSTGGTGKTPLTIALARSLLKHGLRVDVLSRGYGRQNPHPMRVNPKGSAEEFGDEPILIAFLSTVPVYVASQRYEAGVLAEAEAKSVAERNRLAAVAAAKAAQQPAPAAPAPLPPLVHLLDDGFQHRQLYRNVDILLMDRQDWQDGLLPAGNLRESHEAAHRATVIAIPAEDAATSGDDDDASLETALRRWGWQGPIWYLRRHLDPPTFSGPIAAFCGIARPDQFFASLEAKGLTLAARLAFPDHFHYTPSVLENLFAEARAVGAEAFITTEKDLVRLGKQTESFPKSMPLLTARLSVEIVDQGTAIEWLTEGIWPTIEHPAPAAAL